MPTDLTRLFRDPYHRQPAYKLLGVYPLELPFSAGIRASVWTEAGGRAGNARIQLHDAAGVEVFDTDTCFDRANALNKVELWLAEQLASRGLTPASCG